MYPSEDIARHRLSRKFPDPSVARDLIKLPTSTYNTQRIPIRHFIMAHETAAFIYHPNKRKSVIGQQEKFRAGFFSEPSENLPSNQNESTAKISKLELARPWLQHCRNILSCGNGNGASSSKTRKCQQKRAILKI